MIKNLKLEFVVFVFLFGLLAVFLIHNFDSIGQDIGRHLKTGEIIWQTKNIPTTNLFSFTEPDFPFINHHWLSEVIFYGIFNLGGFPGLILLKIFAVLVTFLLLFYAIKLLWINDIASRLSTGCRLSVWPVIMSFLLSIFIFISRTEVRPEIFSYLILAFYLFVIYRAKQSEDLKFKIKNLKFQLSWLWFLPITQLLWVNLHIYFFVGPILFFAFLVDEAVKNFSWKFKNLNLNKNLKFEFGIFALIILVNLANPNFFSGAIYPFRVLNEYGYSIVENQTLAFLADFFGFNLPIFIFKVSVTILVISFALTFKNFKNRIFELLVSAFFIYAGFRMLRNLPLYALASFPILALLLNDVQNKLTTYNRRPMTNNRSPASFFGSWTSGIFKVATVAFIVFMIFFVASGAYYKKAGLSKEFSFSVPNGLERATRFVKDNGINGPMFNNFDIGGYLIWKLPQEKVFVDNRPEAYSVEFFSEVYKPMQESKERWHEFSEKYGINFVFFSHSDATPWGQKFITNIVKNSEWKIIYINEEVIILIKNDKNNSETISKFSISRENATEKTLANTKGANENSANLNVTLSRFFYNIGWHEASIYFADETIKLDPNNPRPYLYKGVAHAYYTDRPNQKLAGENIKKAIDLGLKESRYYYILGVIYMNLGRLDEAKLLFEKALELDRDNAQAKEFLEKYF